MIASEDRRWLAAAATLAERARPLSRPNPPVAALIVAQGIVVGRGWTAPGGRPHAEAVALDQAGDKAHGATLYVTLEPCAHRSPRGPACADLVANSKLARVVIGVADPDTRTHGQGIARLQQAGMVVELAHDRACSRSLVGYLTRNRFGRPRITLKLATSLDGCIATATGESMWITREAARAHTHRERARVDGIVVGGGTLRADDPRLDVRLEGLEARSPQRFVLTRGTAPPGWRALAEPGRVFELGDMQELLIEGGAATASAFLAARLVDRVLLYRAPILIGGGRPALDQSIYAALAGAHDNRWQLDDRRQLGSDTLEVYLPAGSEGN